MELKRAATGNPLERQILGTTNLEGEEGDPQEAQELGENRDVWNSSLSPRTGQDGGLDLETQGFGGGSAAGRQPGRGRANTHTHSPILARLATRIHRATR